MYRRNIQHVLIPLALGLALFLAYQLYFKALWVTIPSPQAPAGTAADSTEPHTAGLQADPPPNDEEIKQVRGIDHTIVPETDSSRVLETIRDEIEKKQFPTAERHLMELSPSVLADAKAKPYVAILWNNLGLEQERIDGTKISIKAFKQAAALDPDNALLSHMPLRRLEAESLRDAVLAVSGKLNPQPGGPGIKPRLRADLLPASQRNKWPAVTTEGPAQWRRSVYIYVKRQLLMPILELFDAPTTTDSCAERTRSVVPTQALVLMNDPTYVEAARAFAARRAASRTRLSRLGRGARASDPRGEVRARTPPLRRWAITSWAARSIGVYGVVAPSVRRCSPVGFGGTAAAICSLRSSFPSSHRARALAFACAMLSAGIAKSVSSRRSTLRGATAVGASRASRTPACSSSGLARSARLTKSSERSGVLASAMRSPSLIGILPTVTP